MSNAHSSRQFRCGQCAKHYSSSSHLRRHEATHLQVSKRPAICTFCNGEFLRSDVLFRHSRTCKQKGTRLVTPGKRGRKRKACNACALSRVACDGDSPCESCLFKGLDCLYGHVQHSSGSAASDEGSSKPDHQETPNFQRIPISFLLNFTDPSIQSPYDTQRLLTTSDRTPGPAPRTSSGDLVEFDQLIETWPSIFRTFVNFDALDPPSRSPDLPYGLDESTDLAELIDGLIRYLEQAPVPQFMKNKLDKVKARAFFSEANIIPFVNAFFENAYKSNPFIHKASFNINTASPHLLLAILLLGSTCISPEDASAAEVYCDAVEYCIFEGPEFRRLLFEEKNPGPSTGNIELIQASIILIELQASRPQLEARRRVRVQRLPAMVSLVRLMNLTRVLNDTAIDNETMDATEYVHKEVLVRVMGWIYLLDSHLVIFYRSPPQLRIFEAHFGLPKEDAVFDAIDPSEIHYILSNTAHQAPPLTLQSVVQHLMDDKPPRLEELQLQISTSFAHFLILCALHCVLFDLQALASYASPPKLFMPIDRALDRWKVLWDMFHARSQKLGTAQSGFMAHSLEFWWLAKMQISSIRDVLASGANIDPLKLGLERFPALSTLTETVASRRGKFQ